MESIMAPDSAAQKLVVLTRALCVLTAALVVIALLSYLSI
jgi:hypothetical protein